MQPSVFGNDPASRFTVANTVIGQNDPYRLVHIQHSDLGDANRKEPQPNSEVSISRIQ
jgi:hypothetical protein